MKTLVFAAGEVGLAVVRFLTEQGDLAGVVLDDASPETISRALAAESGLDDSRIFWHGAVYEDETLTRLRDLAPDLTVLAWWPYIIKEPLIALARLSTLNMHPSFLPYNRGKDPNFWSLLEGSPFGVTLHHVEPGIDNGDIAFQRPIKLSWEDTGATLYERALQEIVDLFITSWPEIREGDIPRVGQDERLATFHTRSQLSSASEIRLDRSYSARQFLNLLRARTFPPHPGAWFEDEGDRYEVRVQITRTPEPPDLRA